jgi:hypothetical protein
LPQVELAETGSEHSFVRQLGLVFGDHRRAEATAKSILDDLMVFRGAEQQSQCWTLMRLANVAVDSFQIEI